MLHISDLVAIAQKNVLFHGAFQMYWQPWSPPEQELMSAADLHSGQKRGVHMSY